MAKAKTEEKAPALPNLPPRELNLVRSALDRVRRIPINSPDDQAVVRMLRIRKNLEKQVTMYDELREQARHEVRNGFVIGAILSAIVLTFGFWRMLARAEMPLGVTNDPVKFLLLFTLLFLLAWSPMIYALIHRRTLRRRADEAPMGNAGPALKVFDVTLVRGLVRTGAEKDEAEAGREQK